MKNDNVIVNRKTFYDQPVDSDINRYQEISNLTTGQSKVYATGFLINYEYIRNHYKLIAVYLRRQKDSHPKAIKK